jgi:CubicO group peptidase (beta-lactamase class C family)
LLGQIIEKVTGKSYAEVLEERILSPLGMSNTGDFSLGEVVPNLADDYMPNGGEVSCLPADAPYCKSGYVNMDLFQATASMYSTVRDLLKWDQALYGNDLLTDESKALMFNAEMPFAWTVGAIPLDDAGNTANIITYDGGINGYTSIVARFPESKLTILILSNNGAGYNKVAAAVFGLAQALLQQQ